jgi:hypothetical protein
MENFDKVKIFEILKKCKFISRDDNVWFIKGCQCEIDLDNLIITQRSGDKFKDNMAVFSGYTYFNKMDINKMLENPIYDREMCPMIEFHIYDEYGFEITDMTYEDYIVFLRDKTINKLL